MILSWKRGAVALAFVFLISIVLIKPIGVSTQFVILDAMLVDLINDDFVFKDTSAQSGYNSSNGYLAKSGGSYAKSAAEPINYNFIFVISMIFGGFLASRKHKEPELPIMHQQRFGQTKYKRYLLCFIGGLIALLGARLAGGCTSGHMMSGMMQTSVSGYLFALTTFAVAIPTTVFFYCRKEKIL